MKIVDCGALPNVATTVTVSHGISNVIGWLSISGMAFTNSLTGVPLPYPSTGTTITIYTTADHISIITSANLAEFIKTYVTLEYYK